MHLCMHVCTKYVCMEDWHPKRNMTHLQHTVLVTAQHVVVLASSEHIPEDCKGHKVDEITLLKQHTALH